MKKILYLGTSLENFDRKGNALHYPVIQIVPRSIDEERVQYCLGRLAEFSHILFTSKNAVEILWDFSLKCSLDPLNLWKDKSVAIGPFTAKRLEQLGIAPLLVADDATQEGVWQALQPSLHNDSYIFYPRSSKARSFLQETLLKHAYQHETLDLYDTLPCQQGPLPDFEQIEEIVFTSPSTVEGFFAICPSIPKHICLSFQGGITQKKFESLKNFG